jgi:hypothetical protein
MDRLALYLHYFIHHKQSNDPGWMHIKVREYCRVPASTLEPPLSNTRAGLGGEPSRCPVVAQRGGGGRIIRHAALRCDIGSIARIIKRFAAAGCSCRCPNASVAGEGSACMNTHALR